MNDAAGYFLFQDQNTRWLYLFVSFEVRYMSSVTADLEHGGLLDC